MYNKLTMGNKKQTEQEHKRGKLSWEAERQVNERMIETIDEQKTQREQSEDTMELYLRHVQSI